MDIVCYACSDHYKVGSIAMLELRCGKESASSSSSESAYSSSLSTIPTISTTLVFAQIRGIYRQPNTVIPYDSFNVDPDASCFFSTLRIALPLSSLFDDGVYIEFDLPKNIAPSFKGVGGSIAYYLIVTVQDSFTTKNILFPFKVIGDGSSNLSIGSFSATNKLHSYSIATYTVASVQKKNAQLLFDSKYSRHRLADRIFTSRQQNAIFI